MQLSRRGPIAGSAPGLSINRSSQSQPATPKPGGSGGSSPLTTSAKALDRRLASRAGLSVAYGLAAKIDPALDFPSDSLPLRRGVPGEAPDHVAGGERLAVMPA